jgi:ribose transport system substrate-binding protein
VLRPLRIVGGLACTAILVVALAACGSSSSSSSSNASASATPASNPSGICVPQKTIGLVELISQSPIDSKTDEMVKLIAKELGWKVEYVDAGGEVNKANTAVQNFVNEKVAMIVDDSVDAAPIRTSLLAAKQAGIPVFETNAGNQPSPLFAAMYNENETTMGKILAEYIVKTVPGAKIGDLSTNLNYAGVLRENAIQKVVKESGGKAKIVADQQVDLTNPVVNTEKTLTDELTAKPEINAVYAVFDNMVGAAVSAIKAHGDTGKAKLFSYFTDPSNLPFLANHELTAVADANLPFGAVIVFDQYLKHIVKGSKIEPDALEKAGGLNDRIVTKPNEVFDNKATLEPYLAKWKSEYPCKG